MRRNIRGKEGASHGAPSNPFCPIVVLGASAGGLEAFQQFFQAMPSGSGMAFVLAQHIDPNHETLIPELLAKHTSMPIERIADRLDLKANHIFVVPPNVSLSVHNCHFRLSPAGSADRAMIDHVFRTLAEALGPNVVGIVLSGTGSDGSQGLKAIKQSGGLTLAQSPESAKYDSMPRSAIATGIVDLVLPLGQIAERVLEYGKHLARLSNRKGAEAVQKEVAELLPNVFPLLREKTGHDFSRYKQSTLVRRIQRRMQVLYIDSASAYVKRLADDETELQGLFKDLLIGVTQFFRDHESFDTVARLVIPAIFEGKSRTDSVRVWVPGCATGEEAYSLAMLLAEHAEGLPEKPSIQIFATDLDQEALAFARKGIYPEEEVQHAPAEFLAKYFRRRGQNCEVVEALREMCVFSPHNLIKDPPFSRLDLISCRNVMIYLEADLQKKLMMIFHYALNPSAP